MSGIPKMLWSRAPLTYVWGAFLLLACKNDMEVIQEVGETNERPFQVAQNATYTFTDSARLKNVLHAGHLEQYVQDTSYVAVSEGLRLDIYDRDELLTATLTSDRGYYFEKEAKMEALDRVLFYNQQGDSLFTEHLIWYSDSSLVITPEAVRIKRADGLEIEGLGLRAKDDFSRYTILRPKGDIAVPDESR